MPTKKKVQPEADTEVRDQVAATLSADSHEDVTSFDLAAWISEAKIPTRRVTVYGRGDLRAELDDVERQIRTTRAGGEQSVTDTSLADLRARWENLVEQIEASAMTLTVRATRSGDHAAAKAAHKKNPVEGRPENDSVGLHLLLRHIESPKMTVNQLVQVEAAIGEGQVARLVQAYSLATTEAPVPSSPFSRRSSQDRPGDTS